MLLQNVIFKTQSFEESFNNIEEHDLIYLDPPYAPECPTSFVGYTNDGFDTSIHVKLFELCSIITNIPHVKFIMSNSNVELVKKHFDNDRYTTCTLNCKRKINSKNPASKTEEVLISLKQ